MQLERKEYYHKKYSIQHKELAANDVVLLHNTRREKNLSHKLAFKWLDPYQIYNSVKDKDKYMLEELNGLRLACIFADNRLTKFEL